MALVVACGPTDFLGAGPGDALYADGGGGFALHEALLRRIDAVSEHHVVQFPPFGGTTEMLSPWSGASCSAIPPVWWR